MKRNEYLQNNDVQAFIQWLSDIIASQEKIDNQQSLPKIINETYQAILQQDDILNLKDYRFNSGMSKVYSLLCDDFIIYDTRVAAALAWLVTKWSSPKIPPELLYFRCGSARKTSRNKVRNPNKTYFKSLVTGESYALWNMRANWVVAEALKIAKQKCSILSLDTTRKVEAALFMVGNDLQFA